MEAHDRAARIIRTVFDVVDPRFAFELWDGTRFGEADAPTLAINDPAVVRRLVLKPNIGSMVELWASGKIDVRNGTLFDLVERGAPGKFKHKLKSLPKWQLLKDIPSLVLGGRVAGLAGLDGNQPYVSGSDKRAISHHYDVSNEFYQLFLDERMVYTCAYFKDWANTLDEAQADKLDLVCRKLRLQPGDRFLDIGCGWGAMLIYAAKHYGVTATGVSLSEAQTALARERIKAEGLADRITVHVQSYEHLDSKFDKISSIGMFEHVGMANYDTYFSSVTDFCGPAGSISTTRSPGA